MLLWIDGGRWKHGSISFGISSRVLLYGWLFQTSSLMNGTPVMQGQLWEPELQRQVPALLTG